MACQQVLPRQIEGEQKSILHKFGGQRLTAGRIQMECTEVNIVNVQVHGEVQSLAVCIGVASIGLHAKTKALYFR